LSSRDQIIVTVVFQPLFIIDFSKFNTRRTVLLSQARRLSRSILE